MTRRIVFSAMADTDRDGIWDHTVARWSSEQAEVYLMGLDRVLSLLAEQPTLAREHNQFDPPVRVHSYRSHLVIFRADDLTLDVLRVVHVRADWAALLPF